MTLTVLHTTKTLTTDGRTTHPEQEPGVGQMLVSLQSKVVLVSSRYTCPHTALPLVQIPPGGETIAVSCTIEGLVAVF